MFVQTAPNIELENDIWTKLLETRASKILRASPFAQVKPFETTIVPAKPRAPKSRKASASKLSPIRSLPTEIFIDVCKFLHPKDLASLSCVCKLYREWLLSPNSSTTQNIWRRSRHSFLRQLRLPPPAGMDELCYIKLALAKECQFCENKTTMVYWAFRVRCCKSCLRQNSINEAQACAMNIPRDVLSGLPFVTTSNDGSSKKIYWRDEALARALEHRRLPLGERASLARKHVATAETVMADAEQRDVVEQHASQRINARNERIRSICNSIISETDGALVEKALYATETYKSMMASETALAECSWQDLKSKLLADYKLMEEQHAKAQAVLVKQLQIIQHVQVLIAEEDSDVALPAGPTVIGLSDLLRLLVNCPSFKHPPGLPRCSYDTPYDTDYLDGVVIPQLQCEAWQQVAHVSDASKACAAGYSHSAIFTCTSCGTGELRRYYSALQHVQTVHKIRNVKMSEELIAIDRDSLIALFEGDTLNVVTWDNLRKTLHHCGFCEED